MKAVKQIVFALIITSVYAGGFIWVAYSGLSGISEAKANSYWSGE